MRNQTSLSEHSPAPVPAHVPSDTPTAPSDTPYLDEHGFDPDAYRWVPVRRKPRDDGWSDARRRTFVEALADSGSVEEAARRVGMSRSGAYRLRRTPGNEAFARAWDAAVEQARAMLVDVAFERALTGQREAILDRYGDIIGFRQRPSDRLLMFLLAAHDPGRYGPRAVAPARPATPSLAEALDRMEPVPPPAPHLTMAPDQFDVEVHVADLSDGKLPPYYDEDRRRPLPEPTASLCDELAALEPQLPEERNYPMFDRYRQDTDELW